MDVHTQPIKQSPKPLDITHLTLMSIPADQKFIRQLYFTGHIQEYAKFLSSRFINRQYTWGFILRAFCQIFGFILLAIGAIIFFHANWPVQSYLYQTLSIELMLIFAIWNTARQSLQTTTGLVFLGLGLLLSIAGITQIFYLQSLNLSFANLLQIGLFFTVPWLILLQKTPRYILLVLITSCLTIIGASYATI